MNIKALRTALKLKWLSYYQDNRHWIAELKLWNTYQGKRRPSSSFILGALAAQEPQLTALLPLVVDLNNNPDRIVMALGLNFNPEEELEAMKKSKTPLAASAASALKMLPGQTQVTPAQASPAQATQVQAHPAQPRERIQPSLEKPLLIPKTTDPTLSNPRRPLDTAQLGLHERPRDASELAITTR